VAAVTGLITIKSFTYRGVAGEEFSSAYHFKGPPPADSASWSQLATDVWTCESKIYGPDVHLVRAYGYNDDAENAQHVWSNDYTAGGTGPGIPGSRLLANNMAGDQAACVWWRTARYNSRGKPIYLRKYIHAGVIVPPDGLNVTYDTELTNFAGSAAGTGIQSVHGGLRSRSHDESVQAAGVIPWVTTRTLKRRGKRPLPG